MKALTVRTKYHHHDPGSAHLNYWTAEVRGEQASGHGKGRIQSEAIKAAVDIYFQVRVVEGLSFDAGCEHR